MCDKVHDEQLSVPTYVVAGILGVRQAI